MEQSIFFWDLPDLKNLCAVKIIINGGISCPDIREKQVKFSRYLLSISDQIVASPIPEDLSQILVIISISFYKTGTVQSIAEKRQVKMERPERVTPAVLQSCLFYTITVRLAPYWNKAGHLLIQGADFLSKSGKQDAVAISINVLDNQLFITVQVHTVRLPPCQLCDFGVASECFKGSLAWDTSFTRRKNDSNDWCYVLPSMKMGRIVHFSHNIPPECPFKSYQDFENYWKMLYGYELPHMSEDNVIYCSVYFKLIGEKLFTYPFICLRSQPIQFFPRADLPRVLNTFVDDLKSKMPHLCGFPVNMTKTPLYPVKELSRPLPEGNNTLLTNLTPAIKWAMSPKNSDQSMYSTQINQRTILMNHSLEHCSEKMEHPSTPLYVEKKTSYNVPLESKDSDSSHPIFSTHSGNVQKYVPVFRTKTGKINQNGNMKITEGNKIVAGSNIFNNLKKYNTTNSSFKDMMPSRMPFVQISDGRMNRANNVLHKPITMKSGEKVLDNSTLLPCLSALSGKQSCGSGSLVPGKNKSDSNPKIVKSSQSPVHDSTKLYCTTYKTVCISHKRKDVYNVSENVKTSSKNIAAGQLNEDILQGSEEHLLGPSKKCRTSKTVKKVDVEQYAQDNKLFKLNNADLQDWLKQHGISTRARDKKEQLVAKILQFIQKS